MSLVNTPMLPKNDGGPLIADAAYKGTRIESSQSRTPAAREPPSRNENASGGNGALKPRETFLDDSTPLEPVSSNADRLGDEYGHGQHDSHDLSLSPRQITRDSLVDHMLLSLDQFSYDHGEATGRQPTVEEEQLYSSLGGDEEPYHTTSNFAPRNTRTGHQYSYSSDYDNADDSSRYSGGQLSRGRRSNSGSNFQTNLGRINSLRIDTNNQGYAGPRPPIPVPPRGIHSRGGKGSQASSSNSFDLGYANVTSNQRLSHALPGRSSSLDYGSNRQTIIPQSDMMVRQNTSSFTPYDYDAAPTPTVPGGPRKPRPASPLLISQARIPDPEPPVLERKRSTRSSKSAYRSKASANLRIDYGLDDQTRTLPPLPAFIRDAAPAPSVAYEKAKGQAQPPSRSSQTSKERPGFFRRVFGTSKSNLAPQPPQSHGSTASTETTTRSSSKSHHIANQMKSQHVPPPSREALPPKELPHVVSKKPSFFRRRKKSTSEPTAVPIPAVPPVLLQSELDLPSPVSSLRKVMNPYLKGPVKAPLDPHPQLGIDRQMNNSPELHERTTRGFSPDYEPDKSATIRTVKSTWADREIDQSPGTSRKPFQSNLAVGPTGLDGQSKEISLGTFLQDSSDNDPDARSNISKSDPPTKEKDTSSEWVGKTLSQPSPITPMSTTPSVARDIAVVAEYERIYSRRSPNQAKFEVAKDSPPIAPPKSPSRPKPVQTPASSPDDGWVKVTDTKTKSESEKENRVYLEADSSDEDVHEFTVPVPNHISPASKLPTVQTDDEGKVNFRQTTATVPSTGVLNSIDVNVPAEGDRERAKRIYDGNEDFIQKEKAAAWMGEDGETRSRTLTAYMEFYDFANLNILVALRNLCGRLVLKAESQQVDRILDAFAQRWCQCNPNHGFKCTDVVHTICYSILLLNTDLHLADIEQKMTRSQFIKNTMPTVRKSVSESVPDAFETRPSVLPGKSQAFSGDPSTPTDNSSLKPENQRLSVEAERPSWRSSFKPLARGEPGGINGNSPTPLDYDDPANGCGPLVKAPFHGTLRTWEVQVEIVLKDFYSSIRNERLPLFGAPTERSQLQAPSTSSLAVFANGVLRRTPSVLSKTPSEGQTYIRGRTAQTVREGNTKWGNKNRSRPRLYPGSSGLGSSRTSLDDQSSMWSPSVNSSTWSKYSLGKTHTSMSVDSVGSSWPQGDYQQSIGFANALSQAIIREETIGSTGSNGSDHDELRAAPLLEDESLELAGAPWAKEGIVKHKHHLESLDKKAKDRNWNEVFAVVEKGYLSLFSFSTKSMRNKPKQKGAVAVVGGGNWQENAASLGSFLLRQTIASALPSPGYSKARPHVWALSLPTGAVHLFQVGTPDIVKEFVSTANYWSARLSNHPLVGGISNIEYGWSDGIVHNDLVNAIHESVPPPRPSSAAARPSMHSSHRSRSSLDQGHSRGGSGAFKTTLPGDRIMISDWTPPTQSMRASNLLEADQLQTLVTYVAGIEDELQKHNQLRSPMLLAFTPRHHNHQKAMANWEKKSSYLLREIVKFRTYIDCLQAAEIGKQRIYADRVAQRAVASDENADTTVPAE